MLADRAADRPESYRAWCVDPTTTVRDETTKAAGAGCVVSGRCGRVGRRQRRAGTIDGRHVDMHERINAYTTSSLVLLAS